VILLFPNGQLFHLTLYNWSGDKITGVPDELVMLSSNFFQQFILPRERIRNLQRLKQNLLTHKFEKFDRKKNPQYTLW
jgi:hypothetical protein